jgi:hypothetical protein
LEGFALSRIDYAKPMAIALGAILAPTLASAATPRAMLEKSASYALDNQVRAFRVPTIDSAGRIKYYDVTIKLTIGTNGTIASSATVTSSLSPVVPTAVNQPGTYKASDGTTCVVTNITLSNGRIQSYFRCTSNTTNWEMSVASGPISSGHPYQSQLVAAGANQLPDAATYTWGVVTAGSVNARVGGCPNWTTSSIVGAKTDGNLLIMSLFDTNPFELYCGGTLVKQ